LNGGVIIPDKETAKALNDLARHKAIVRLLADIRIDLEICELEDTVIIRNNGGYFGTVPSEVMTGELPFAQSENDWIPCTKKAHPDTPFRVQVQLDNGWIITAYYQDGEWLSVPDCGEPLLDKWIEAWRELPEPYRKDGEADG